MRLADGYQEDDPNYMATYDGEWVVTKQSKAAITFEANLSDTDSDDEGHAKVLLEASAQEVRQGRGLLIRASGERYDGYFENNKFSGRGRLTYPE